MFGIIRLIIGIIFLIFSIIVIRKSIVSHKRVLYFVSTGVAVALIAVLTILPFENLFITFDSPKSSYEYYTSGKSNIELIVEGTDCDLVVDCKNDAYTCLIIPKNSNGWKIGTGLNTKRIFQKISNGITVYIYQYKNTNDYFITIFDTSGGELEILDSYNTEFEFLKKNNEFIGKEFTTYYAYIPNFNSQYCVVVNGYEIVFEIQ
ncbi:MAG: hypothetical protein IJX27_00840 [Clostridia bacterium]|nr:hypothetical protein [Clostridia bacterium]